jgi:RNA polymerase sporulation-specific sigma factor
MSECANSYDLLPDDILAGFVKNGDDDAFKELMVRYIGTIGCIARKFSAEGYEHNDFVQEGLMGLLQACRSYDKSGSASFKSYMSVVVQRRYISIIRSSNTSRKIPRTHLIQIDDIDDSVEDNALNPEEQVTFREHLKSMVEKLKMLLSKTEFDVLMLYGNGLSYKQISGKLSISEKSVDNALQRARKKISAHNVS